MMTLREGKFTDEYTIEKEIGRGGFSVVLECRHNATGNPYAVKLIKKLDTAREATGTSDEVIRREVEALRLARGHPKLVQLVNAFNTLSEAALVFEIVRGGELFDYLASRDVFEEEEAITFMKQLLDGLGYLHKRSVVHLDIKPENILLLEKSSVASIKLIDFGLARKLDPEKRETEEFGTPEFVCPEIVYCEPLTVAADMWSVGVITYILLSGMSPFLGSDDVETIVNVREVNYDVDEDFGEDFASYRAINFVEQLLVRNPRARLTAFEALQHPWINPSLYKIGNRKSATIHTVRLRKFNLTRKRHLSSSAAVSGRRVRLRSLLTVVQESKEND